MDLRQSYNDEERTSLVFSVRGPIPIQLDDNTSSWGSGSSVLDLIFPQPETVSEIRFKNYYTARLSLLARFDDSMQSAPKREHLAWAAAATLSLAKLRGVESTEGIKIGRNLANTTRSSSDWTVSLQSKILMPDPHTETGSQDVVIVSASESLVSLHDVTALRFILRQPSPNWKKFNVEEISVFRDPLIKLRGRNPGNATKSDSGISSAASNSSTTSTSSPKASLALSMHDSDKILDQLARQTAAALQGGRLNTGLIDDDSTSSSDAGTFATNPQVAMPTAYDIMCLNF